MRDPMKDQARAESKGKTSIADRARMQGFPAVEALIAGGNFETLNASFRESYEKLSHIAGEGKGFGRVKEAKKAIRSLELTADLLRHLLQIKQTLIEKRKGEAITSPGKSGRKV